MCVWQPLVYDEITATESLKMLQKWFWGVYSFEDARI